MSTKQVTISEAQKVAAEEQISKLRKEIDYNTRDYTIDFLIQQFRSDEFYIPDEYQRQYIWNEADKNRFVESILLGLPIPLMFFSDTEDGRCEIIDGAQRTQAMEEFMSGDLVLSGLKKLNSLNGFSYNDVPAYLDDCHNIQLLPVGVVWQQLDRDIFAYIDRPVGTRLIRTSPDQFEVDRLDREIYTVKR